MKLIPKHLPNDEASAVCAIVAVALIAAGLITVVVVLLR